MHCVLLIHVVAVIGAMCFIWLERKVAGRIQDRLGPTRFGGKYGWLQTAGGRPQADHQGRLDAARTLMRCYFALAPYISFCASFAAYIALPFADGWVAQISTSAYSSFWPCMGLEVFGVILGRLCLGLQMVVVRRDA